VGIPDKPDKSTVRRLKKCSAITKFSPVSFVQSGLHDIWRRKLISYLSKDGLRIYFKENPNDYFCKRIDRRTFKLFRFEFFGAVGLRMRAALRPANPFPRSNI
jgi:hypothetical protein